MNQCSNRIHCALEFTNLVPRALFPAFRSGVGKGLGISQYTWPPNTQGCTKSAYDHIRYTKDRRWRVEQSFYQCFARSDFLWVTVAFLNFKPIQVKCFEPIPYMPTLPDYAGVSRIRHQSPGLPYGSLYLPDKIIFWAFLCLSLKFSPFLAQNLNFSYS